MRKGSDGVVKSAKSPSPSRSPRGPGSSTSPDRPHLFIQSLGAPPVPRRVPEIPGLDVATGALLVDGGPAPASAAGCFSDVFALPGGFALVCGDVYGRARRAASQATTLKSRLREEAVRASELWRAVFRTARILGSSLEGPSPLELLLARFEPESSRLTLCSCGSWPPLLLREGRTHLLGAQRPGSAGAGRQEHMQSDIALVPGDVFVAYSNGIPEARQDIDRIFGLDPIRRLLEHHPNDNAQALVTRILTLVSGYARKPFADDAVVLVARAHPLVEEPTDP